MADYRTVKADSLINVVRSIVKAGGSADREADLVRDGLLRGACHRARIRATRWLAMTISRHACKSRGASARGVT
jgi:hypothetical protein